MMWPFKKKDDKIAQLKNKITAQNKNIEKNLADIKKLGDDLQKSAEQIAALKTHISELNKGGYDITKKSLFSRIRLKFSRDRQYLINMELRNGKHTSFIVKCDAGFDFEDGLYLIDDSLKYEHLASGLYALDYHQDIALPIVRKIDISQIKQAVKKDKNLTGAADIDMAMNPRTLVYFIKSKIAQMILHGVEIGSTLKTLKILMVIVIAISLIHFLLFLNETGIIARLTG